MKPLRSAAKPVGFAAPFVRGPLVLLLDEVLVRRPGVLQLRLELVDAVQVHFFRFGFILVGDGLKPPHDRLQVPVLPQRLLPVGRRDPQVGLDGGEPLHGRLRRARAVGRAMPRVVEPPPRLFLARLEVARRAAPRVQFPQRGLARGRGGAVPVRGELEALLDEVLSFSFGVRALRRRGGAPLLVRGLRRLLAGERPRGRDDVPQLRRLRAVRLARGLEALAQGRELLFGGLELAVGRRRLVC